MDSTNDEASDSADQPSAQRVRRRRGFIDDRASHVRSSGGAGPDGRRWDFLIAAALSDSEGSQPPSGPSSRGGGNRIQHEESKEDIAEDTSSATGKTAQNKRKTVVKTEGKAKRQKPEALEESLKLQLAQLVEASKAYYRTRLSDKFPWADLFKHANQLLSSDGKLYAQSLLHAEASPQLRARCVREQPIYAKPDTPQELLNNVLHQVAQCRALSVDLEGDKPNPLALAAFRACKPYWLAHKYLDYEVAVKLLLAIVGIPLHDGLALAPTRPLSFELWDRAFSRQVLTQDEVRPLLARLGFDARRCAVVGKQGFVGDLTGFLYEYMMSVTAGLELPLPPVFFRRMKGVFDELTNKGDPRDLDRLERLLIQALHQEETPLRGTLLSQAFFLSKVASKAVDTYPCVVLLGKTGSGKSTFLNLQCYSQLPKRPDKTIDDDEYRRCAEDFRRGMLYESESQYSALEYGLESVGGEDAEQRDSRAEYLDQHFQDVLQQAHTAFDDDTHKRQRGEDLLAGWDEWTDQPTVPPFLLPTRSVATGSCTACTTILLNAPVVCAGAWYKSKDTLVSQAFKLYEQLRDDAQCSRVEVGHVLQDLLRQLLGQPTLTWAQTDPHHWLGDPTQPRLEHKNEFRDRLLSLMDEVEAGKGWKRLLDHRPLAVAAGRGTCLAEDLGHVSQWIAHLQDPETNALEVFLDVMYVCFPLRRLGATGAFFTDPPGTADVNLLRSERAKHALVDAEVVIHLTGADNVARAQFDAPFLKPYWKHFLREGVEGFERPKRYLWNLMRGPVADPAVCRKEALGAYAKWAARSGLDEGRFAEQADVRCKVFDLTCRDDREAAVTDLCGVLERCARAAKESTYSGIADRLESGAAELQARLQVLHMHDFSTIATLLLQHTTIEALDVAGRAALYQFRDSLLHDLNEGITTIKAYVEEEEELGSDMRRWLERQQKAAADGRPVSDIVHNRHLDTMRQKFGSISAKLEADVNDVILKSLGLGKNNPGKQQQVFTDAICAKLKELVGTLQVAAADVDKVTTLLRRKAENYFIPHFEQIRLKANSSKPFLEFKRNLRCMLLQEPRHGRHAPRFTEENLWKYFADYHKDLRTELMGTFNTKGRTFQVEVRVLLEEFNTQDPAQKDTAVELLTELKDIAHRLAKNFRDSARAASPVNAAVDALQNLDGMDDA